MSGLAADPRPRLFRPAERWLLAGDRCLACGYPLATRTARCPACRAEALRPALFGPRGTVWSATVVRVGVPDRQAPWALAYVDLDAGPRVLAHVAGGEAPAVGARVLLAGETAAGDLLVEVSR